MSKATPPQRKARARKSSPEPTLRLNRGEGLPPPKPEALREIENHPLVVAAVQPLKDSTAGARLLEEVQWQVGELLAAAHAHDATDKRVGEDVAAFLAQLETRNNWADEHTLRIARACAITTIDWIIGEAAKPGVIRTLRTADIQSVAVAAYVRELLGRHFQARRPVRDWLNDIIAADDCDHRDEDILQTFDRAFWPAVDANDDEATRVGKLNAALRAVGSKARLNTSRKAK